MGSGCCARCCKNPLRVPLGIKLRTANVLWQQSLFPASKKPRAIPIPRSSDNCVLCSASSLQERLWGPQALNTPGASGFERSLLKSINRGLWVLPGAFPGLFGGSHAVFRGLGRPNCTAQAMMDLRSWLNDHGWLLVEERLTSERGQADLQNKPKPSDWFI